MRVCVRACVRARTLITLLQAKSTNCTGCSCYRYSSDLYIVAHGSFSEYSMQVEFFCVLRTNLIRYLLSASMLIQKKRFILKITVREGKYIPTTTSNNRKKVNICTFSTICLGIKERVYEGFQRKNWVKSVEHTVGTNGWLALLHLPTTQTKA